MADQPKFKKKIEYDLIVIKITHLRWRVLKNSYSLKNQNKNEHLNYIIYKSNVILKDICVTVFENKI